MGLEGQLISEHTILNLLIKKYHTSLFNKLCTQIEFPGIFNLETSIQPEVSGIKEMQNIALRQRPDSVC